MKNLQKINIIITTLLCVAVGVLAVCVSAINGNVKNGGDIGGVGGISNVNVAAAATPLFDANGNYNPNRSQIVKGAKFEIFGGYTWTVVAVNGNKATFWVDEPIEGTSFEYHQNIPDNLANASEQTVYNTFNNGYTNGRWNGNNLGGEYGLAGVSLLKYRTLMRAEIWGLNTNNKVLAGPQTGLNVTNPTSATFAHNGQTAFIYFQNSKGIIQCISSNVSTDTVDISNGSSGTISLDWSITN
ncbi:MAG: hypothetical protein LBQ05_02570, partial [Christensenellaceae bacterium]|nr:hypothetical protein [Christensenellaceae bacterium]